jgi:tetratricopeptide (TPR) repeat protein
LIQLQKGSGDPELLLAMGSILLRQGRYDAAAGWLEKAWRSNPRSVEAAIQLALSWQKIGRLTDALRPAEFAARAAPTDPESLIQLGCIQLDLCNYPEAIRVLRAAIALAPANLFAYRALAQALRRSGNLGEESHVLRSALLLAPDSETIRTNLIDGLISLQEIEAATREALAFVAEHPGSFEARCALAQCYLVGHRPSLAEAQACEALLIKPANGQAAFHLGTLFRSLGRLDDAESLMRRSIELEPVQGSAYAFLSFLRKSDDSDRPRIERMTQLCSNDRLATGERSQLHYGLGKSLEDLREYEAAIGHFDEANRLAYLERFGNAPFDPRPLTAYTNRTLQILESAMARKGAGVGSQMPIFVIGMIRSGTTLVDQILSSHGQVGTVGEDRFWIDRSFRFFSAAPSPLDPVQIAALGRDYLERLAKLCPDRERVVDKMPINYAIAPLIHLALPGAKFIHVVRNRADNCLSIYTTLNHTRIDWAHGKDHIAFAYREYERAMDGWRRILPPGAMMELSYEELASDPERTARDMIGFCGLDWDDSCLHPEKNPRSILTPSAWQVRQPIYQTSIARWKNYEPWIREFLE